MRPVDRPRLTMVYILRCSGLHLCCNCARVHPPCAGPRRAHCRPLSCASKLSLLTNRDCHRKTSISIRSYDIRCDATYGLTEAQKVRARERCVR